MDRSECIEFVRWYYSKYGNELEEFIVAFPDARWDIDIASNFVSLEFIEKNPSYGWNFSVISERSDLTWDFIKRNAFPYDWSALSRNVSFQTIKENCDHPWNKHEVLVNPTVTYKDIRDKFFKGVKPRANYLSFNPNIPMKSLFNSRTTNWWALTKRAPLNFIWKHLEKPWLAGALAERKDVDINALFSLMKVIVERDRCSFYVRSLSRHPQINLSIVRKIGEDMGWDWSQLSRRVPFQEILDNPDMAWNPTHISCRREVTLKIIKDNPKVKFWLGMAVMTGRIHPDENPVCDWFYISASPFVTIEKVLREWDKPWNPTGLSWNLNMTVEIIKKNPQIEWVMGIVVQRFICHDHQYIVSEQISKQYRVVDLLLKEIEIRRKEIYSVLEDLKVMVPDVNRIIAGYSDYK